MQYHVKITQRISKVVTLSCANNYYTICNIYSSDISYFLHLLSLYLLSSSNDSHRSSTIPQSEDEKRQRGSIERSHETIPNYRSVRFISQQLTRSILPLLPFFLFHLINSLRFKVPLNCSSSSLSLSLFLSPSRFVLLSSVLVDAFSDDDASPV